MPERYRVAVENDVPTMVELSDQRRQRYAQYQPVFWRPAADARERHEPFLRDLLARDNAIVRVHERGDGIIDGFILAMLVPAPPVYDPGGLTCSIDDFCLADAADWESIGRRLLDDVMAQAKVRGASQVVVVCGHLDQPKRAMLAAADLSIASEWYVRPL